MRSAQFVVTWQAAQGADTAVLQARADDGSFVAHKLARTSVGAGLVDREARMLQALSAAEVPVPRFVGSGQAEGRRYCATRWWSGSEVRVAAAELRDEGRSAELLDLCSRVARTYSALHAGGVLHGQVHPRHVLVDGQGNVALLDFSLAALASDPAPADLLAARFHSLSAPEHAASLALGEDLSVTVASEQYSLAALLYLMVTGRMYAQLRLQRPLLISDITTASVRPFTDHGFAAWPELEAVLSRALNKDPGQRYATMDGLAEALEGVSASLAARRPRQPPVVPSVAEPLAQVLGSFRHDAFSADGLTRQLAPTCSINFGAAGVAFALTRLGKLTADAAVLEQAERWLSEAEAHCRDADAFDDGDELTAASVGTISPFHSVSGLAATRAFLSEATHAPARQQAALDEFRCATQTPCANLDLTLGRSSVLLVAALLYASAQPEWPAARRLRSYGDELCAGIWRDARHVTITYYGVAHGWAGLAYATLMWAQASETEPPREVRRVLDALASAAEPYERALRWPLTPPDGEAGDQYWPGWCHGSAGYVFLWNLARSVYGDDSFGVLADRAVRPIVHSGGVTSLCCGTAGHVYALLNHYRASGDERWRARAVTLANRAATEDQLAGDATSPLSLYKGHTGLALLAAELSCPERAAMPLFEFEPSTP